MKDYKILGKGFQVITDEIKLLVEYDEFYEHINITEHFYEIIRLKGIQKCKLSDDIIDISTEEFNYLEELIEREDNIEIESFIDFKRKKKDWGRNGIIECELEELYHIGPFVFMYGKNKEQEVGVILKTMLEDFPADLQLKDKSLKELDVVPRKILEYCELLDYVDYKPDYPDPWTMELSGIKAVDERGNSYLIKIPNEEKIGISDERLRCFLGIFG